MPVRSTFVIKLLLILSLNFFTFLPAQASKIIDDCTITNPVHVTNSIASVKVLNVVNTTLGFECDAPRGATNDTRVGYCFNVSQIGPANQTYNPRIMYYKQDYISKRYMIYFDFYSQNNNSGSYVIVGDEDNKNSIIGLARKSGNKYVATVPVQLRIQGSNRDDLPTGDYTYGQRSVIYGGATQVNMAELEDGDSLNTANVCGRPYQMDNTRSNAWVNMQYQPSCYIHVNGDMAFKSQPKLDNKITQSIVVNSNCGKGIDYTVSINNGNHYKDGSRHMTLNGNDSDSSIAYSIDPESWQGRGLGETSGLFTTVTGTVLPQTTPEKGSYHDQLVVQLLVN